LGGGGGVSLEPQVYRAAKCKYADRLDTVSWGFHTHCKVKVLCYVRLPTDTHSWFHVRRSFHKIRQNWGVQILHNSTIIRIHVHNMTYTRRTFWYGGELCSFGSRCDVNPWFAIPEWAVFTQMTHFQQCRCMFLLKNGYVFGPPRAQWWTSCETPLWAREPCHFELIYIFDGEEFHTSLLYLRITYCRYVATAAPHTCRCEMFGCSSFLGRLLTVSKM